jgi:hypothetical protein
MSVILPVMLVASAPMATIPEAFQGTWTDVNEGCEQAGLHDRVKITKTSLLWNGSTTIIRRVHRRSVRSIEITADVSYDGVVDLVPQRSILSLSGAKNKQLSFAVLHHDGYPKKKIEYVRFRKCS